MDYNLGASIKKTQEKYSMCLIHLAEDARGWTNYVRLKRTRSVNAKPSTRYGDNTHRGGGRGRHLWQVGTIVELSSNNAFTCSSAVHP